MNGRWKVTLAALGSLTVIASTPPLWAQNALAVSKKTTIFCNKYAETIEFAFAFRQNGNWTSAGWLTVPRNTCRDGRIVANYYRAKTIPRILGKDVSEATEWGRDRVSGKQFCIDDANFVFHDADLPCSNDVGFQSYRGSPDFVYREIIIGFDGKVRVRN
jgi:uncharacterized membrane protein